MQTYTQTQTTLLRLQQWAAFSKISSYPCNVAVLGLNREGPTIHLMNYEQLAGLSVSGQTGTTATVADPSSSL